MEQCCANCKHLRITLNGEDYCNYQQDYICPSDRYRKCCTAWMWDTKVDD
jgi:hypothetical protein